MEQEIEKVESDKLNKALSKILLKYLFTFLIAFVLLIFTIVFFNRVNMFGRVFGSFSKILEIIGIVIYFVSLIITLLFHAFIFIFIIVDNIKKKPWEEEIISFDKKLDIINYTFKIFALLLFIMIFLFTPCTVKGDSMNPTFLENQNIICNNYCLGSPKKNDIIVFDARSTRYEVDDVFYIKRVVAIPGSKIRYDKETTKFYVDDIEIENITNDQFGRINVSIDKEITETEYVVPKKKYLVFGDNRNNSLDSRYFGYINKNQIFGRVSLRIFPLNKFKFF